MHDVLRQRLLRRIESLPEEQIYQVLDFIEFLETKYAGDVGSETTRLQRFAERLEDRMRRKAVSPGTLREAFQLIATADRVLSSVSSAGKEILDGLGEIPGELREEVLEGGRSRGPSPGPERPSRAPEEGEDPARSWRRRPGTVGPVSPEARDAGGAGSEAEGGSGSEAEGGPPRGEPRKDTDGGPAEAPREG